MITTEWVDESTYQNDNKDWQLLKIGIFGHRVKNGKERVDKLVNQWHILNFSLVATPKTKYFLPPICVPELQNKAHNGMLIKLKLNVIFFGMGVLGFLINAFYQQSSKSFNFLALTVALFAYLLLEYKILSSVQNAKNRIKYNIWVYEKTKLIATGSFVLVMMFYLVQIIFVKYFGSLENLISVWGAVFIKLPLEPWRFFTGSIIHANFIHAFANAMMLAIASSVAVISSSRSYAMFIFWASIVFSFALVGINSPVDAIVGISPGIYGLFGWAIGVHYCRRKDLPNYLWLSLLSFVVINYFASFLLSANVSSLSHLYGFIFGILIALISKLNSGRIEHEVKN